MRLALQEQPRLDCPPVEAVQLNVNCRDEIIPILRALQHVYGRASLRGEILELVGNDVNAHSSPDRGRTGSHDERDDHGDSLAIRHALGRSRDPLHSTCAMRPRHGTRLPPESMNHGLHV